MEHTSRIYLDYAASTPTDDRVWESMQPYWKEHFGNAGSLHEDGVFARKVIEQARARIAASVDAATEEIIFTSGGTESNNLAILGSVRPLLAQKLPVHIITSSIEHSSVLDCYEALAREGAQISYAPVTSEGLLDLDAFRALLQPETYLVSVLLVSNEIGTIQPIADLVAIVRAHEASVGHPVYVHSDASQGHVYVNASFRDLGVDLLTLDGQKMYGPKGVGALVAKRRVQLAPILFGGTQERGLRPGTPVTPLIVGLAEACSIARAERETLIRHVLPLRDQLCAGIQKTIPTAHINGSMTKRIANSINFSFPGKSAEMLVYGLDRRGISVSTRSACLAGVEPGSHVIRALGRGGDSATSAVRMSVGRPTTSADIETVIGTFAEVWASTPDAPIFDKV
jgi:cysteine desulfurase